MAHRATRIIEFVQLIYWTNLLYGLLLNAQSRQLQMYAIFYEVIRMDLRKDCDQIVTYAISQVQPDAAVRRALENHPGFAGRLLVIAVGKAAWTMARAAIDCLGCRPDDGIVITKYHHSQGPLEGLRIMEAGHPVPDENTFLATQQVLSLTENLTQQDTVLFLLSGGGSALFELPLIPNDELQSITKQLLACGADIMEINTIRKRLSKVKGGRFAQHCAPAQVMSIILSDIIGDPIDMIASGPAYPDSSTCQQALAIAEKYQLALSAQARALLGKETPKELDNVVTQVTGSVRQLCVAAAEACSALGYRPTIVTDKLTCEAKAAGTNLAEMAKAHQLTSKSLAFIAGGETVVKLTGSGLGGRNQELALSAAEHIGDCINTAIFSIGSDGTDGPTDAAGGFVTEKTGEILEQKGIRIADTLADNDSYHALKTCDGLIITGPTGTNVNDVAVVLIKR